MEKRDYLSPILSHINFLFHGILNILITNLTECLSYKSDKTVGPMAASKNQDMWWRFVDFEEKYDCIKWPASVTIVEWRYIKLFFDSCLLHLLRQNTFCPGQYWNCPGQIFCSWFKNQFFAFKSHSNWIFLVKNKFSKLFQKGNSIWMTFESKKWTF